MMQVNGSFPGSLFLPLTNTHWRDGMTPTPLLTNHGPRFTLPCSSHTYTTVLCHFPKVIFTSICLRVLVLNLHQRQLLALTCYSSEKEKTNNPNNEVTHVRCGFLILLWFDLSRRCYGRYTTTALYIISTMLLLKCLLVKTPEKCLHCSRVSPV